jgi:hypothetical protein
VYDPTRALSFTLSYRHEQRESNDPFYEYVEKIAAAGVKFKWGRYPSLP